MKKIKPIELLRLLPIILLLICLCIAYVYSKTIEEDTYVENSNSDNSNGERYSSDELERQQDEETRRKEEEEKRKEENIEKETVSEEEKIKIENANKLYNEAKEYYYNFRKENETRKANLEKINDNLIDKLKQKGFISTSEDCNSNSTCLTNGTYLVKHINNDNPYYDFYKSLDKSMYKSYDCASDFNFFSNLYNISFSNEIKSSINKLLSNYNTDYYTYGFNIESDNIDIYFSYDGEKIRYRIHGSYNDSFTKINYFD